MASPTRGIQQLMVAEKLAENKVAEARKRKLKRVKEATDEAEAEIERYRLERHLHFKEFEAKHMGSKDQVTAKIDADAQERIDEMDDLIKTNQTQLVDDILELVYDIKPKLHVNLKRLH